VSRVSVSSASLDLADKSSLSSSSSSLVGKSLALRDSCRDYHPPKQFETTACEVLLLSANTRDSLLSALLAVVSTCMSVLTAVVVSQSVSQSVSVFSFSQLVVQIRVHSDLKPYVFTHVLLTIIYIYYDIYLLCYVLSMICT